MVRENGTLLVEVADDGRGAAAAVASAADGTGAGSDSGYGLIGMRERVAAYDGELYAGPRPGGGWRVRAVFPVGAA
jgi:signal transduction histidine kinase